MTTVINIRSLERDVRGKVIFPPGHIYIGRANLTYQLEASEWGNPWIAGMNGSREDVIRYYEEMISTDPRIAAKIVAELTNKVLVCFCKDPANRRDVPCHGDILAKIANLGPKVPGSHSECSSGHHIWLNGSVHCQCGKELAGSSHIASHMDGILGGSNVSR